MKLIPFDYLLIGVGVFGLFISSLRVMYLATFGGGKFKEVVKKSTIDLISYILLAFVLHFLFVCLI